MKGWLALALLGLLAAVPAAAQDRIVCTAGPALAACADGLARAYGVPTISTHFANGDTVLRVFLIDRHGNNRLLIAFTRATEREPTASVHYPPTELGPTPAPIQAPLPETSWDEALWRADYADRSLVPSAPNDGFCLDPWALVFEASEPARVGAVRPSRTRRHVASICDEAPLIPFFSDLTRLALPLFPACQALETEDYRGPAAAFLQCPVLAGDRLAAARVVKRASGFELVQGPEYFGNIDELFFYNATIDWNGRRTAPGAENPAEFWAARVGEDHVTYFVIDRAEGLSADRVRITGRLGRSADRSGERTIYIAPFEQIWVQERVQSATVGAWTLQREDRAGATSAELTWLSAITQCPSTLRMRRVLIPSCGRPPPSSR